MHRKLIALLLFSIISYASFAQQDYEKALHLATYFLGAQRSGDYDSWIHGASHTQDGVSLNPQVDLSGGWHDCGDYIKFSFTNNWAATMYLLGYHLFPEAYLDQYSTAFSAPPSNGIPDVLDEVKIQTDYIIRSYNNGNPIQQVGHGTYDHNGSFSEPVTMSAQPVNQGGDPRPVYLNEDCPNITGSAAAALALMAMTYEDHDASYAALCLQYAKYFYGLGVGKSGSCGSVDCFSGGSACYDLSAKSSDDEMAMAAACLYEATGENSYLVNAQSYFNFNEWVGEVLYYGNMNILSAAMLYKTTGNTTYLDEMKEHFDFHNQAQFSSLGFYKYQYSGGWGNLQYTGNEAFVAAVIHLLDGGANPIYYNFTKSNVDFILGGHNGVGNVPANFSFLIGYDEMGGGYPLRPHHKAAFGSAKTDWSLFTLESNAPGSVAFAFELKGALVGGPNDAGQYHDKIDDFQNSEVCTYYNGGFTGAAAYVRKIEEGILTKTPKVTVQDLTYQIVGKQLTIAEQGGLRIYNHVGKLVCEKNLNGNTQVDLSNLKSGIYTMHLPEQLKWARFVLR